MAKIFVPHLPILINPGLTIAGNKENKNGLRKVAMIFIQCAVSTKSKIIRKNNDMLVKILETAFTVSKEAAIDYEEDEETVPDAAIDLLEQYSAKIPNKIIYPILMQGCEAFLKSPEPLARRAALLILGSTSKGVEDSIKKNLESVLNVVLQFSADPSVEVQEACIITLCYFADNLMP